ncbi:MAG: DUF5615 family PIN-like protein [Gemmatimonadaceae bacterium]
MRLLFDEQLPEALVAALSDVFPESLHIRLLGQSGASDSAVWELARAHGCLLVTKDEDFHRLSVLRGAPPKVVWLRVGNCTTRDLVALLRHHAPALTAFHTQHETTVLELG